MRSPVSSSTEALVLRSRAYGESDKILTFLTRDFGKLSAVAKGALRSKRRFMNSLEPFARIRLEFRTGRGDLDWIESAEVTRPCRSTIRDLDRYAWSTYLLELVDCMVEGREADARLFDLADSTLARIDESFPGKLDPTWLRTFEARLLALCGVGPQLDRCNRCNREVTEEKARFRPETGTAECASCSDGGGFEIRSATLRSVQELRDHEVRVPDELAGEVRMILQSAIAYNSRRSLRSPALLRAIVDGSE